MASAPKSLSSSSQIYFPQQGTHAVHALDTHGELRTAMIVGGDRLVLLKHGVLVAESDRLATYVPSRLLTSLASASQQTQSPRGSSTTAPSAARAVPSSQHTTAQGQSVEVHHVTICVFSLFSFRVAVATNAGILLFELDDLDEVWRDASASSEILIDPERTHHSGRTTASSRGHPSGVRNVEGLHGVRSGAYAKPDPASPLSPPGGASATHSQGTRRLRCQLVAIPAVIDHQLPAVAPLAKGAIAPLGTSNPLGGARGTVDAVANFTIRVRHQPTGTNAIRHVSFASEDTLCVLSREEAVLFRVTLNTEESDVGSPVLSARGESDILEGVVLWRSIGTYQRLAVCPVNHHVALTLPGSTVVVFPCKSISTLKRNSAAAGHDGSDAVTPSTNSYAATPAFSPTMLPATAPGFPSSRPASCAPTERTTTSAMRDARAGPHDPTKGIGISLSERGLTTSLGAHVILDMRWHRVSTHTLLCVTCAPPGAPVEEATLALFTVQSLPVLPPFSNVVQGGATLGVASAPDTALGLDGSCAHPVHRDGLLQLIPAGTIPLAPDRAVPRGPSALALQEIQNQRWSGPRTPRLAELHTQLVPAFSRSSRVGSLGNELTFLHVEGDGTVRTSSYRFGQQRHASFAKQRAEGHVAAQLLAPLMASYGALRDMQVLPAWKSRGVEFGAPLSGTAQLFMNTRRYRFVATFVTGVIAVVMVDMTAVAYRVECFLTMGAYRVCSLLTFATPSARASVDGGDGTETLVAALLRTPEVMSGTEDSPAVSLDASLGSEVPSTSHHTGVATAAATSRAIALFAQRRSDSGLATQLLTVAPVNAVDGLDEADASCERRLHLVRACATADGVALSLRQRVLTPPRTPSSSSAASAHAQSGDGARSAQFVLLLPPVTVESLGPTQSSVAVGTVNIPNIEPGRLLRVPADFLDADAPTPTAASMPGVSEADMARLQRVRRQLCATNCSNEHGGILKVDEVKCRAQLVGGPTATAIDITISATVLDGLHVVRVPLTDPATGRQRVLMEIKSKQLVNNDVVVGVRMGLCPDTKGATTADTEARAACVAADSQLLLYGLSTVQRVYKQVGSIAADEDDGVGHGTNGKSEPNDDAFMLEHTVHHVSAFFLGGRGEVLTVVEGDALSPSNSPPAAPRDSLLIRWLRCFPSRSAKGSRIGYHYAQDDTWCYTLASPKPLKTTTSINNANTTAFPGALTTQAQQPPPPQQQQQPVSPSHLTVTACDAFRWSGLRPQRSVKSFQSTQLLLATNARDCLLLHSEPFASGLSRLPELSTGTSAGLISSYHPDALMQLIGMARWDLVRILLEQLARAIRSGMRIHKEVHHEENAADDGGGEAGDDDENGESDSEAAAFDSALVASCLARRLCTGVVGKNLRDAPVASIVELSMPVVCPPQLTLRAATEQPALFSAQGSTSAGPDGSTLTPTTTSAGSNGRVRFTDVFNDQRVLSFLSEAIPQVSIQGLSSGAQMGLLCIVEALSSVGVLSRNVDEAATRFFFLHRLASLRHRLRLPESTTSSTGAHTGALSSNATSVAAAATIDPSSILFFEQGKTAARAVTTTSYAWAALSDSQAVLIKTLFLTPGAAGLQGGSGSGGSAAAGAGLTWKMVDRSGAAYWLQSVPQLRYLAEQVARTQYQTTKSIVECALMYCVAQKVGTLAALCKQQSNLRLQAFFQRDFGDDLNREAASANAFAAIGKNMPLYGAAFFILAGDVRSAAQVILQRTGDAVLALFVLRAGRASQPSAAMAGVAGLGSAGSGLGLGLPNAPRAASDPPSEEPTLREDLEWYREARHMEASTNDVDPWEDVCLSWLEGDSAVKVDALHRLARHPTGHPEVLSLLRYVRDGGVMSLANRGEQILPVAQEIICAMRLSRFCFTRRLVLQCTLHLHDAEAMLAELVARHEAITTTTSTAKAANAPPQVTPAPKPPAMVADYASGTLAFKGFGDDDDDDSDSDAGAPSLAAVAAAMAGGASSLSSPSATAADALANNPTGVGGSLDAASVSALRAELSYMSQQIRRNTPTTTTTISPSGVLSGTTAAEAECTDKVLYALLSSLFLATAAEECTLTRIQWCLTALLEALQPDMHACEYVEPTADAGGDGDTEGKAAEETSPPRPTLHTHQAFVSLLHLAMMALALRARHMLLAYALLSVPADLRHLRRCVVALPSDTPGAPRRRVHPCAAFFVAVFHHMRAQLLETVAAADDSSGRQASARLTDPLWLPAPTTTHTTGGASAGLDGHDFEPPDLETAAATEAAQDNEKEGDSPIAGTHKSIFDTLRAAAEAAESRSKPNSRMESTYNDKISGGDDGYDASGFFGGGASSANDGFAGDPGARADASTQLHVTDDELSSALFSLCALQQYWRVLRVLRGMMAPALQPRSPTTQRAIDLGVLDDDDDVPLDFVTSTPVTSGDAQADAGPRAGRTRGSDGDDALAHTHPFAGWLMVCCAVNIATLHFNALADELVARLMCADWTRGRRADVSVLTDPNGVLLEMELALKQTSLTLCAALGTAAAELTVARIVAQEVALEEEVNNNNNNNNNNNAESKTSSSAAAAPTWRAPPYTFFSDQSLLTSAEDENSSATSSGNAHLQAERRKAVLLCQVCTSYAEVFWQFPTSPATAALTATAIPSRALMRTMATAAAGHRTASVLLTMLCGPRAPATTTTTTSASSVMTTTVPAPSATGKSAEAAASSASGTAMQLFQGLVSAYRGTTTTSSSSSVPSPSATVPTSASSAGGGTTFRAPRSAGSGDEVRLWCVIKSSWLRRHHTHLSLRQLLLQLSLRVGKQESQRPPPPQPLPPLQLPHASSTAASRTTTPSTTTAITNAMATDAEILSRLRAPTDRILLRACHHSVVYVNFDRSSCDSVVWSNEAGTGVDYGVREVFAGDNEWALEQQLPERSMATKVFSAGLAASVRLSSAASSPTGHGTSSTTRATTTTTTAAVRDSARTRPLMATAPMSAPCSHPHLPFFLANHRDGHIDLYPFASPECVAYFACPQRNSAITRAAFSPNGYHFCAGLQDGAVAIWHFTAEAMNALPRQCFPALFASYTVRNVFFAGERSSIVCATGAVMEPHPGLNRAVVADAALRASFAGRAAPTSSVMPSTTSLSSSSSSRPAVMLSPSVSGYASPNSASATAAAMAAAPVKAVPRQPVGELLLIDVGQDEGRVLVRCALPFLPEYAAYVDALDAVLCVSLEGYVALYEVRRGALTIVGEMTLTSVLGISSSSSTAAAASSVVVTAVCASPYDALVAIATSTGAALVLTVEQLMAAVTHAQSRAEDYGETPFEYHVPDSQTGPPSSSSGAERRANSTGQPTLSVDEELGKRASRFFHDRPSESVLCDATVLSFVTSSSASQTRGAGSGTGTSAAAAKSSAAGGGLSGPAAYPPCAVLDLQFTPSMLLAGLKDGKVIGVSLISHGLRHLVTAYNPI